MTLRVVICRSNPIAPDPRVEKIARTLAGAGYEVILLGWDRSGRFPVDFQSAGIRIHRLPIKAEFGNGLGNLPNLLRWQMGLMNWLWVYRRDYDLIHACDFDTVLPAMICKKLWGKQIIYDIFDFYADHLRETPKALKQMIRVVDLKAIGWADGLILADDSRWEQIRGAKPKRAAMIYNSPEEQGLLPKQGSRTSQLASLRLAYVGLLQIERGLFEMLEVMKRHPEWSLDLAGFGGDEEKICKLASELPNVTWHGRIPYDQALQLSQEADALFATYDPSIANHRYSSPNKVFEAMMLGKPVIVARSTNMDRIIEAADCGIVVDYGDIPALETAIARLQSDPDFRLRLGGNARKAYESTYGWSRMQARLLDLYCEVTKDRSVSTQKQ